MGELKKFTLYLNDEYTKKLRVRLARQGKSLSCELRDIIYAMVKDPTISYYLKGGVKK